LNISRKPIEKQNLNQNLTPITPWITDLIGVTRIICVICDSDQKSSCPPNS